MSSSRPQSRAPNASMSMESVPELFPLNSTPAAELLPGSLNDESVVRGIITDAIRNCTKTRESIAEEMTLLLGDKVTVRMLNSYTSEAAEQHRWPAQYTRAFCHATGDWRLLRCITERAGFHVISRSERQMLELGRQILIQKRAAAMISRLEEELAEVAL